MINLREYKERLEELMEKRKNAAINDNYMDYTDLGDQIYGYYRDIAEIVLYSENILDLVQRELEISEDPDRYVDMCSAYDPDIDGEYQSLFLDDEVF